MFKLTIMNKDSSVYWTEYFSSIEILNKWLEIEMSRPYWKIEFSYSIEDITQPAPTPEEIQAERARANDKEISVNRLKIAESIIQSEPNISGGLKVILRDLIKQFVV